jgi:competence protein ComEA
LWVRQEHHERNDIHTSYNPKKPKLPSMQLHPEELQRIAALVILAILIVLANATKAYWPKDQPTIPPPNLNRDLTEAESYILGNPMNLNRATAEEIELLPGIGPKLASRIAEAAPFTDTTDLDTRVKGLGAKLLANLQRDITLTPAPTSPTKPPEQKARQ